MARTPAIPGPTLRQTRRPLRPVPLTAKIPMPSICKGDPLYAWNNRGEAPRRWLLSEPQVAGFGPKRGARRAQGRPPQHKPP